MYILIGLNISVTVYFYFKLKKQSTKLQAYQEKVGGVEYAMSTIFTKHEGTVKSFLIEYMQSFEAQPDSRKALSLVKKT